MAGPIQNTPSLWIANFPRPLGHMNKYHRGHAIVVSGPMHATGAARLAARGALRVGGGLVSVASPMDAVAVNAAHLTAIMVKPFDGVRGLQDVLIDVRITAIAIGPGLGLDKTARALVETSLGSGKPLVLDADAISTFAGQCDALFALLHPHCLLTPHEGEFARIFPALLETSASRCDAAREAAHRAGCVVLLKGAQTIIATPEGDAVINDNGPPTLATAGSGDVLTGFAAGLMAQGMGVFDAACSAAWLHGEAATRFGPGLIAEDIPELLPEILRDLLENP